MPPNPSGMPLILSKLASNIRNPNYWYALVSKLMKQIPLGPSESPYEDNKLANRIAQHNPKVYDGKYIPVELEEWIRGMEKISQ